MAAQKITFTDGSTERWDLLVGADGPRSRVCIVSSTNPPLAHAHTCHPHGGGALLSPCHWRHFLGSVHLQMAFVYTCEFRLHWCEDEKGWQCSERRSWEVPGVGSGLRHNCDTLTAAGSYMLGCFAADVTVA